MLKTFSLVAGIFSIVLGLADIAVTLLVRKVHQIRNIAVGLFFIALGSTILWLLTIYEIVLRFKLADDIFTVVVVILVFGSFLLKAVLDIREGSSRTKEQNLPSGLVWKYNFRIIGGIITIVFFVFALLAVFSQLVNR